jgi:hypothetical protein
MSAARTANVTEEGIHTVVRFSGRVRLPQGTVSVREIDGTGEVVLTPITPPSGPADTWDAFLDHLASTPRDPEFMKERPLNRPPVDRKLFSDE